MTPRCIPASLPAIVAILLGGVAFADGPSAAELHRLHERMDSLLRTELKQRWYPAAIDRELGGFHQTFSRDWKPLPDENRFLVFQSRMVWTAAAFAEYSEADRAEYAKYVAYGVDYLDRVMRDSEGGGFHFVLSPRGTVDPKIGSEKHVYGTAFALYAASKAAHVIKSERAKKVAVDAFEWLERCAHDPQHGGYFEAVSPDGKPVLSWKPDASIHERTDRLGVYYGYKSMNSHIHLLEALAEFVRIDKRPLAMERLRETLAVVRDRIAVEPGALNLYLTRDWRPVPAHDSFGHDVETAYLLVEAAEAAGMPEDEKTWRMARMLVDHALDWGWDEQHGGFYDKGDSFAGRAYDTTKVWWTQAEGLNALLVMHRRFGKDTDRYWSSFLKQWDFIEKHQIDPKHGGWFGDVTREGRLLGDGKKITQWKVNYHTSRALMNVATSLRAMERQAAVRN